LQGATAGTTREFIVLGHEVISGNFSRIPGSIMVLAERMGNLHGIVAALATPFGAAAAAGAALAAGFVYLGVKAIEASNHIHELIDTANLFGTRDTSMKAWTDLSTAIMKYGDVSRSVADQAQGLASKMKDGTDQGTQAAAEALILFSKVTGDSLDDIEKKYGKFFEGDITQQVSKFVAMFSNASADQVKAATEFAKTGDQAGALALMLEVLGNSSDKLTQKMDASNLSLMERTALAIAGAGATASGTDATNVESAAIQELITKYHTLIQSMKERAEANKANTTPTQSVLKQGDIDAKSADPEGAQRQKQVDLVARLTTELQTATEQQKQLSASMDTTPEHTTQLTAMNARVADYTTALSKANEKLADIDMGPYVARVKEGLSQTEAAWSGSRSTMLYQEATTLKQAAEADGLSEKQRVELRTQANEKMAQANRVAQTEQTRLSKEANAEALADAKAQVSDAVAGSQERIAAARNEMAVAAQLYGQGSRQWIAAQSEYNRAVKEYSDENIKIQEQEIQSEIKLVNEAQKQKVKAIQDAYKNGQITLSEETADLVAAENERWTAVKAFYDKEIALAANNRLKHQQLDFQEKQDFIKHTNDLKQINQTAYDQMHAMVVSFTNSFTSSFANGIKGMIEGTSTMKQAFASLVDGMLSQFLSNIAKMVSQWIAGEIMKLAATTASEEAQVAVKGAAAIEKEAIDKTTASSSILMDAKNAAAGAYNAIVGIPYVGPVLAPIAAATAFAAVAAFGSFDVGTPSVPNDMVANVHQGEIIVPRTFSDSIRSGDMTLGGPGGNTGGSSQSAAVTVNITAVDAQSVHRLFQNNGAALVSAIAAQSRNLNNQMRPA
jgi:hypothetical protein